MQGPILDKIFPQTCVLSHIVVVHVEDGVATVDVTGIVARQCRPYRQVQQLSISFREVSCHFPGRAYRVSCRSVKSLSFSLKKTDVNHVFVYHT